MDKSNPKTFVGTGKLEEIKYFIKDNDIKKPLFWRWLTPSQQKILLENLIVKY